MMLAAGNGSGAQHCLIADVRVSSTHELQGLRMARSRRDHDAVAVKVAMKQPSLRPALATSSQVPGTGIGIPDG